MSEQAGGELITVTGASGYVAMHCIVEALRRGYRVRGTLRSTSRRAEVERGVAQEIDAQGRLELMAGVDLNDDANWDQAMAGARYVLHLASPVPAEQPSGESEVIEPALAGTRRALDAAARAEVARVAMTSSIAAVSAGHPANTGRVFDEGDWSNLDGEGVTAYQKSKTLAEKLAWQLADEHGLELVTIHPAYVIGPVLIADTSASLQIIKKLIERAVPGVPDLRFPLVDVRDVARMHLEALTRPEAAGRRFILAGEPTPYIDIARALQAHFAGRKRKVPTRQVPKPLVRLVALFDKTARMVVSDIGKSKRYDAAPARDLLGWQPRPLSAMVGDCADSLIEHGLVR